MLMALCLPVAMNDLESSSIIPGVSSLTEDTLRLGEVSGQGGHGGYTSHGGQGGHIGRGRGHVGISLRGDVVS